MNGAPGNVLVSDGNGGVNKIGSYQQLDVDLSPLGQQVVNDIGTKGYALFVGVSTEFAKNAAYAASGAIVGRAIGGGIEALQAARATQAATSTGVELTSHAALRLAERGITQGMVNEAVQTAEQTGAIKSQVGQYGTIQNVYHGTNGVSVVVETEGRNAGKAVTAYITGSK